MPNALIGHTGFVGGNLVRQTKFEPLYHSLTIENIVGRSFDLLVCAGAPAEKWRANQQPERDWANLHRLMTCLGNVRARQFVLISTVDVFARPCGVHESTLIETDLLSPYGWHRYLLEQFVRERFDQTLIVRLPGLFGPGLKKNVIFDLLHDNQAHRINSQSVYQFYDLRHLWNDLQTALDAEMSVVHFATAPVAVAEVAESVFGRHFVNEGEGPPAVYDMRSQFDQLYGGADGYLYAKDSVLDDMREFVAQERSRKQCA